MIEYQTLIPVLTVHTLIRNNFRYIRNPTVSDVPFL
jgi:hypothetical protein